MSVYRIEVSSFDSTRSQFVIVLVSISPRRSCQGLSVDLKTWWKGHHLDFETDVGHEANVLARKDHDQDMTH